MTFLRSGEMAIVGLFTILTKSTISFGGKRYLCPFSETLFATFISSFSSNPKKHQEIVQRKRLFYCLIFFQIPTFDLALKKSYKKFSFRFFSMNVMDLGSTGRFQKNITFVEIAVEREAIVVRVVETSLT